MPDSLCRLTVAACSDDAHCAVDLALPADMYIGQLMPQIVDLVHRDADRTPCRDWRLSRLGDPPMDELMTLNDNNIRDGDVLVLTAVEPPAPEWVDCDPSHAVARGWDCGCSPSREFFLRSAACSSAHSVRWHWSCLRRVPPPTGLFTGTCLAVAAAVGAAVVRRVHGDPLTCVPLSLVAVLYAGAIGFLSVPPGSHASGLLLASAVMFSAAILLLRVTGCGRTCLTATGDRLRGGGTTSAAAVTWSLQLNAGGAALVTLSFATLAFAPRLSMVLSGTAPDAAPNVGLCHRILTGLVVGSSIGAALGATSVAIGEIRDAGSALRGTRPSPRSSH